MLTITNFPLLILVLTVFIGVTTYSYQLLTNFNNNVNNPPIIAFCRSLFPLLFLVLLIKSFLIAPYVIPTGSLKPTIIPGDFILANQFQYGIRLPVWRNEIMPISHPRRGQIVLFHSPVNPKRILIKRVIGLPGDHISYINKVLYVNDKKMQKKFLGYATDYDSPTDKHWQVVTYKENLAGTEHKIFQCPKKSAFCPIPNALNFYNVLVPKGKYFVLGDNRDNSDDSRYWGFVPYNDLIGRAMMIWLSWNSQARHWYQLIRWHRIGLDL